MVAFLELAALPDRVRGPVERRALALLEARRALLVVISDRILSLWRERWLWHGWLSWACVLLPNERPDRQSSWLKLRLVVA